MAAPMAQPAANADTTVLAATTTKLSSLVTDETSTLSSSEKSELESSIRSLQQETGLTLYIAFVSDFDGDSGNTWAKSAVQAIGGNNVAVFAVSTSLREYGLSAGSAWNSSTVTQMNKDALAQLSNSNWYEAAAAAVAAADGSSTSSSSSSSSSSSTGSLVPFTIVVILGLGAVWVVTRRIRKKRIGEALEAGRNLDPSAQDSLKALPEEAVRTLADEQLVNLDQAIMRAKSDYEFVHAELGEDQVSRFARAISSSEEALKRAYAAKASALVSPAGSQQRIDQLADVVAMADASNKSLQDIMQQYSEKRNVLLHAPEIMDKLTQQLLEVSARIPAAGTTLTSLRQNYAPDTLAPLANNIELAQGLIAQGNEALSQARVQLNGSNFTQAGLLNAIHVAETAINEADKAITAIEHAQDNINAARIGIDSMVEELREELREAHKLLAAQNSGANIDWDALRSAVQQTEELLGTVESRRSGDPLGIYEQLIAAHTTLDELVEQGNSAHMDQTKRLRVLDQQIDLAHRTILSAEDLINNRGRIVGAAARSNLTEANAAVAEATRLRTTDTVYATQVAQQAIRLAQQAYEHAKNEISTFERNNNPYGGNRNNRGGGFGGNGMLGGMLAGMIISDLFNSGHHHGGGFGGFGGDDDFGGFGGFGGGGDFGGGFGGGDFGGNF
ncbi:MAG: TPM domain-containing protein [Corynebacterium sp.]|nr:TPM domain-containing protein [Corynebacterium sp.]